MYRMLLVLLSLLFVSSIPTERVALFEGESLETVPVAYRGRFRPMAAYARMWLYEFYHDEQLAHKDWNAFSSINGSAMDLLWKMHFLGHEPWDDAPLFFVRNAELKFHLGLDPKKSRFSYHQLAALHHPEFSHTFVSEELDTLRNRLMRYEQWGGVSKQSMASQSDALLRVLPSRQGDGVWLPLSLLKEQGSGNFTLYSKVHFEQVRAAYFALESSMLQWAKTHGVQATSMSNQIQQDTAQLVTALHAAYEELAGQSYLITSKKHLTYPTIGQLHIEVLYYRYPWVLGTIFLYLMAIVFLCFAERRKLASFWGLSLLGIAFGLHLFLLLMRIYILERPPVSNMLETMLYVPCAAVLFSAILYATFRNRWVLIASALVAVGLLLLSQIAPLDPGMENVQPVLDSHYWLIIHVLMVVGSYGAFALGSVLGHIYLVSVGWERRESPASKQIASYILQTLYVGLALLIPGTILGGVWAAESWGRFWDWDPKESWAFISSCAYLICVHAYRFGHIKRLGLAIGAVLGFLSISFTWYGVNYILGAGLHTYGFGMGGEFYYGVYVFSEIAFLTWLCYRIYRQQALI